MERDLPPNSNVSKRPQKAAKAEKKVERVVQTEVKRRKKPLRRRFAETFTGDDSRGVMDYVIFDVMIPAAKDMFFDMITMGAERKLFGEARPRNRRHPSARRDPRVDYTSASKSPLDRRDPRPTLSRAARARHDFDDLILGSRAEANEILAQMQDLIDQFDVVTVQDLYIMCDETPAWTDGQWGWFDLINAGIRRERGGYLLALPRPEPID